uniref:Uncharacterized protein n=1 Tax=Meloidogyne incognita TaxID=6306 RepID=A0A914N3X9_MELIC
MDLLFLPSNLKMSDFQILLHLKDVLHYQQFWTKLKQLVFFALDKEKKEDFVAEEKRKKEEKKKKEEKISHWEELEEVFEHAVVVVADGIGVEAKAKEVDDVKEWKEEDEEEEKMLLQVLRNVATSLAASSLLHIRNIRSRSRFITTIITSRSNNICQLQNNTTFFCCFNFLIFN